MQESKNSAKEKIMAVQQSFRSQSHKQRILEQTSQAISMAMATKRMELEET